MELLHPLVHCSCTCASQGRARPTPEPGTPSGAPVWVPGTQGPGLVPSAASRETESLTARKTRTGSYDGSCMFRPEAAHSWVPLLPWKPQGLLAGQAAPLHPTPPLHWELTPNLLSPILVLQPWVGGWVGTELRLGPADAQGRAHWLQTRR